ncbi:recombinase RecA [Paraburkholderia dipogonis]|uniref:recombinase RecA n=1 Tax=Paraburkholderia dipogonis TaxID=1211383 RepID=UPI0038BA2F68
MPSALATAEEIHPSLWRASQLARGRGRVIETGYPALSAELPGGGWPLGALVDLMVQQAGVGELRLLRPALSAAGNRPVAFVQPPHTPDGLGLSYIGLSIEQVLRVKAQKTADALWSAQKELGDIRRSICQQLHNEAFIAAASHGLFFRVESLRAGNRQPSLPSFDRAPLTYWLLD